MKTIVTYNSLLNDYTDMLKSEDMDLSTMLANYFGESLAGRKVRVLVTEATLPIMAGISMDVFNDCKLEPEMLGFRRSAIAATKIDGPTITGAIEPEYAIIFDPIAIEALSVQAFMLIVGHEIGHIVLEHVSPTAESLAANEIPDALAHGKLLVVTKNEIAADAFAINILAKEFGGLQMTAAAMSAALIELVLSAPGMTIEAANMTTRIEALNQMH